MDNRKENLRLSSQSDQNANQKKRERTAISLPDDCGIDILEIPRCVYYSKPRTGHGERFVIEIKKNKVKHQ